MMIRYNLLFVIYLFFFFLLSSVRLMRKLYITRTLIIIYTSNYAVLLSSRVGRV